MSVRNHLQIKFKFKNNIRRKKTSGSKDKMDQSQWKIWLAADG